MSCGNISLLHVTVPRIGTTLGGDVAPLPGRVGGDPAAAEHGVVEDAHGVGDGARRRRRSAAALGSMPHAGGQVDQLHRSVVADAASRSAFADAAWARVSPVRISSALSGVMPSVSTQVSLTTASTAASAGRRRRRAPPGRRRHCPAGGSPRRPCGSFFLQVAVEARARRRRPGPRPPGVCALPRREVAVGRGVDRGDVERLVLDRRPGPARSPRRSSTPSSLSIASTVSSSMVSALVTRMSGGATHARARPGRRRRRGRCRSAGSADGAGAARAEASDGVGSRLGVDVHRARPRAQRGGRHRAPSPARGSPHVAVACRPPRSSVAAADGAWPGSAPSAPDLRVDGGHHLVQVADHGVRRPRHHRRLGVGVDREDVLRRGAAGPVLDRAADPARDVELGRDPAAGLADLLVVRPPARAGDHPGDARASRRAARSAPAGRRTRPGRRRRGRRRRRRGRT